MATAHEIPRKRQRRAGDARTRTGTSARSAKSARSSAPPAAAPASAPDLPTPIKVKYARGRNHELLVTVNDAAKLAAVSRRTIYNWMAAGKVDVQIAPSGTKRVVVKSIWQVPEGVVGPMPHAVGGAGVAGDPVQTQEA